MDSIFLSEIFIPDKAKPCLPNRQGNSGIFSAWLISLSTKYLIMIKLLPATPSDIPTIYQLAVKIWNHHYVPIVGRDQVEYMLAKIYSTEDLMQQMTEKKHQFYLIEIDEYVCGFISVSGEEDMFIHKFYIDQDVQGKGYGAETFRVLLNLYLSAKSFNLTVNRSNYKSINFYFKLGFKIDRVADFDIGQGYFMNDFVMKWEKNGINY